MTSVGIGAAVPVFVCRRFFGADKSFFNLFVISG